MFSKKRIIFLIVAVMLLVSNMSAFAEENNVKSLKDETDFYSGAIVGYNASEEKEIFGDLSQNEIDTILNSIAKEVAKPGINYNARNIAQNYDVIDFSKLFIKTLDKSTESMFINNENFSNELTYKSSSFSKRVRFLYTVYLTHIDGNDITSKYQTTLTRTDEKTSGEYGFSNMVTEQQPGAIFTFRYKNVYSSDDPDAYVRFSHYNLQYMSWWRLDFNVSSEGEITAN